MHSSVTNVTRIDTVAHLPPPPSGVFSESWERTVGTLEVSPAVRLKSEMLTAVLNRGHVTAPGWFAQTSGASKRASLHSNTGLKQKTSEAVYSHFWNHI